MSEAEIQAITEELTRLGCTEVKANGVTSSDKLVLLQCEEEKTLVPISDVKDLLKDLEVPDNAPPDRFVWYMVEEKLAPLSQNP